jgi:hypothetical protein
MQDVVKQYGGEDKYFITGFENGGRKGTRTACGRGAGVLFIADPELRSVPPAVAGG